MPRVRRVEFETPQRKVSIKFSDEYLDRIESLVDEYGSDVFWDGVYEVDETPFLEIKTRNHPLDYQKTERNWLIYSGRSGSSDKPHEVYVESGETSKQGMTRYKNVVHGNKKNFYDDAVGQTNDRRKVKEALEEHRKWFENKLNGINQLIESLE